jgi:Prenyltransferase and squalene oxidase repeat
MLSLCFAAMTVAAAPAPVEVSSPTEAQVREAVGKSLPFLSQSSAAWRDNKKCVSCHQIPFTLWSLHEARRRGFAVDAAKLDDLTDWSFDFCATNKYKEEFTGGFHLTMVFLILAHESAPKSKKTLEAEAVFEPIIARRQAPDGSWKEGNQISVKGAEREAKDVDTLWTVLALGSLEGQGAALPQKTRQSAAAMRVRALAWLKDAKSATRADWQALRLLVERRFGKAEREKEGLDRLLAMQNKDGGWPFVQGDESTPHTTGEVLYVLSHLGVGADHAAVRRACKYLLDSQEMDGSWKAYSRSGFVPDNPKKVYAISNHWGSGWATIGLLETLPIRNK